MEVLAGHSSPHSPVSRYEDGGRGPLVEPFAPDDSFNASAPGAVPAFGGRDAVTAHEPGCDGGYDLDNEGQPEDEGEEEYEDEEGEGYSEEDDEEGEGEYDADDGHPGMRQQQDAGPTMDLGLSEEEMEGMGGMLSDVASLKDELAKQMLTITQEVARVQVELQKIKGDTLGQLDGMAQVLNDPSLLEVDDAAQFEQQQHQLFHRDPRGLHPHDHDAYDEDGRLAQDMEQHPDYQRGGGEREGAYARGGEEMGAVGGGGGGGGGRQRKKSNLRAVSQFGGANGFVAGDGRLHEGNRRIRWASEVVDNAKGPGEDSLSDAIKKRSRLARQRRGGVYDESTLSQTLVYCFAVFLISNVFPRALQMLFDLAKQQGGDYEDGDGGEF